MPASDIPALYKNHPVSLWVEDELTRAWLQAAWGAQGTIGILVAGGGEHLKALVSAARKQGLAGVYALADRDFREGGLAHWSAQSAVLRLDAHEVENLLLDPVVLAQSTIVNPARRNEADIRTFLHRAASSMTWGMALGATLRWLDDELVRDFPSPGSLVSVETEAEARERIFGSAWWPSVGTLGARLSQAAVEQKLRDFEAEYARMLAGDEWRSRFGGKELLGRLLSWLWTKGRPAGAAGAEAFAREVGALQAASGSVPPEATMLRTLLDRVASAEPPA